MASIYTGPWINWSHGPVFGWTLTLTSRDGAFLLTFLAFFVTIAGSELWRIVSFCLHQHWATEANDPDGLIIQQQAVLRNSQSPLRTVWTLLQIAFTWRKVAQRPLKRTILSILWAIVVLAATAAASLSTSEISKSEEVNVLIHSSKCGYEGAGVNQTQSSIPFTSQELRETISAADYVQKCYGNEITSLDCAIYQVPRISWKANVNATCPFPGDNLCYFGNTAAYEADTGLIDSNNILGLNAPKGERLSYRKVSTCAPIRIENFITTVNETVDGGQFQDSVLQVSIGATEDTNYTYWYDTHAFQTGVTGYHLTALWSLAGANLSTVLWTPIPQFHRSDADVSVFFLTSNRLTYDTPVDDPIFSAHQYYSSHSEGVKFSGYTADQYVTSLACVDQHQFCNPTMEDSEQTNGCTPLTGNRLALSALLDIGLNDLQMVTARRFINSISQQLNIYNSVAGRETSALLASQTVYNWEQPSLPNNQWQIEVANWFEILLAKLQQGVVDYALNGGAQPVPNDALEFERVICGSQKIHNPSGYQNFSVLGIAIVLIGSSLVIFLGMTIDTCVGWAKRLTNKGRYSRIAWDLDQTLQLQRMAQEGAGWGPFTKCTDTIPRTAKANQVGLYNVTDKHPGIARRGGAPIPDMAMPSGVGQSENDGLVYYPSSDLPAYQEEGEANAWDWRLGAKENSTGTRVHAQSVGGLYGNGRY